MSEFEGERISKVIARSGLCSRRDAERLITNGKVRVNGERIKSPAFNVTDEHEITVNGKALPAKPPIRVWLYHKPTGVLTSHSDPEGRPCLFDQLPESLPEHVISIGRLDMNSEGLLLLTNDGELARHLEHPDSGWLRKYRVRMHGFPSEDQLRQLKRGITVDDVTYRSIKMEREKSQSDGANQWALVTLQEGKNREIRRVCDHLECPVSRLIRISYGPFQLGNLAVGEAKEVPTKALKNALGKAFENKIA